MTSAHGLDPAPPESAATVLVVEDDAQLSAMLVELLTAEGYRVESARDGQRALHLGLTRRFDAVLLDRGLPAIDGIDLLTRLRHSGRTTPVLILSALGLVHDRIEGLDAGAEDYLAKPFDVEELLARVRALLRRHADAAAELPVPGGRFEVPQRLVRIDTGSVVDLSARESRLLEVLARQPRQVFTRTALLDLVFADAEDSGVVDTYVHYLRRKLGRGVIRTVRGIGYQLGLP